MAYSKTNWVNDSTPLNASNMNKIEEGIYNNSLDVEALKKSVNSSITSPSIYQSLGDSWEGEGIYYYKRGGVVTVSGKITPAFNITGFSSSKPSKYDSSDNKFVSEIPTAYIPPFGIHILAPAQNNKSAMVYLSDNGKITVERFGPGTSSLTTSDPIWFTATYLVTV